MVYLVLNRQSIPWTSDEAWILRTVTVGNIWDASYIRGVWRNWGRIACSSTARQSVCCLQTYSLQYKYTRLSEENLTRGRNFSGQFRKYLSGAVPWRWLWTRHGFCDCYSFATRRQKTCLWKSRSMPLVCSKWVRCDYANRSRDCRWYKKRWLSGSSLFA